MRFVTSKGKDIQNGKHFDSLLPKKKYTYIPCLLVRTLPMVDVVLAHLDTTGDLQLIYDLGMNLM